MNILGFLYAARMIQIRPYEPTFSRNDWEGFADALVAAGAEVDLIVPTANFGWRQASCDSIIQFLGDDLTAWARVALDQLLKMGWSEFRNRAPKENHETVAFVDLRGKPYFTVERPLPVDQISQARKAR